MNIGILTFQFAHNYGAVLQAYATKYILEQDGANAEVINYTPQKFKELYSNDFRLLLKLKHYKQILNIPKRNNQVKKFQDFQKDYLNLTHEISDINDKELFKYDSVVVGSDQVWNSKLVPDIRKYLLENVNDCDKYSYGASLGSLELSIETKDKLRKDLNSFRKISVREISAANLLNSLLGTNRVKTVVDPVLLLSKEQWRALYQCKITTNLPTDYVLYIDLYQSKELLNIALNIGQQLNKKVIAIHPTCWDISFGKCKQLYNAGPLEFLSLIDHANTIVTDSFHAVAFSYIFEKKLFYQFNGSTSSRITDFLNLAGINDFDNIIQFKTSEQVNDLIKESKEFLHNILYSNNT